MSGGEWHTRQMRLLCRLDRAKEAVVRAAKRYASAKCDFETRLTRHFKLTVSVRRLCDVESALRKHRRAQP